MMSLKINRLSFKDKTYIISERKKTKLSDKLGIGKIEMKDVKTQATHFMKMVEMKT